MRTKTQALGITRTNDWLLSLNAPHHPPKMIFAIIFALPGIQSNITHI